jgi:hypothetical protein
MAESSMVARNKAHPETCSKREDEAAVMEYRRLLADTNDSVPV